MPVISSPHTPLDFGSRVLQNANTCADVTFKSGGVHFSHLKRWILSLQQLLRSDSSYFLKFMSSSPIHKVASDSDAQLARPLGVEKACFHATYQTAQKLKNEHTVREHAARKRAKYVVRVEVYFWRSAVQNWHVRSSYGRLHLSSSHTGNPYHSLGNEVKSP